MEAYKNQPPTSSGKMAPRHLGRVVYGPASQIRIMNKALPNRVLKQKQKSRELRVVVERIPAEKVLELTSRPRTNPTTSPKKAVSAQERLGEDPVSLLPMVNDVGDIVGMYVHDSFQQGDRSGREHVQHASSPVAVSADLFHMRLPAGSANEPGNPPGVSHSGVQQGVLQPNTQVAEPAEPRAQIRQLELQLAEMHDARNQQVPTVPNLMQETHGFRPIVQHHYQPEPHDVPTYPYSPSSCHQSLESGPVHLLRPQPVYPRAAPVHNTCGSISPAPRHQPPLTQFPLFHANVQLHPHQVEIPQYGEGNHHCYPHLNPRPPAEFIPGASVMFRPEHHMEQEDQGEKENDEMEEQQHDAVMQEIMRISGALVSETTALSQNLLQLQQTVQELRDRSTLTGVILLEFVKLLNTRRRR